MYHLKRFASNPIIKQELSANITKILPVAVSFNRNYAGHQIPDRLKDVATAKGELHRIANAFRYRTEPLIEKISNQKILSFSLVLSPMRIKIHASLTWSNIFSIAAVKLPKINWLKRRKVARWRSVRRKCVAFYCWCKLAIKSLRLRFRCDVIPATMKWLPAIGHSTLRIGHRRREVSVPFEMTKHLIQDHRWRLCDEFARKKNERKKADSATKVTVTKNEREKTYFISTVACGGADDLIVEWIRLLNLFRSETKGTAIHSTHTHSHCCGTASPIIKRNSHKIAGGGGGGALMFGKS